MRGEGLDSDPEVADQLVAVVDGLLEGRVLGRRVAGGALRAVALGIGQVGVEGDSMPHLVAALHGEDVDRLADLLGAPEDRSGMNPRGALKPSRSSSWR